jgi:glucosamine-6-phosphate deaminase
MRLVEAADYADLSRIAANIVLAQVKAKATSLLVLPTGNTPLGMFRALVAAARRGEVDFSSAHFVMLDEYAGIAADDRRRLYHWIRRELIDPVGVPRSAVIAFDPEAEPGREVLRVEEIITEHGGIDLAVLGLGPNGHVGMNEPGSAFDGGTRLVTLAPESIRSNAAYWGSVADVPRQGLTLGLGTLGSARSLLLIVSGAGKAAILEQVLEGTRSTEIPATALRSHPACTVIADRAALGRGT